MNLTDANLPSIVIQEKDASGYITRALSSGSPVSTATVAGYFLKGCIIADTSTGDVYQNEGTPAVPSWNDLSVISVPDIDLADGKVIIGDATNKGAEQSVSGELKIESDGTTYKGITVKNNTANTFTKGYPLHLTLNTDGTVGAVAADALSNIETTHITSEQIIVGGTGFVYESVLATTVDTSTSGGVGDYVYTSTPGVYTFGTFPDPEDGLKQIIGVVKVKDAVNGEIQFAITPPSLWKVSTDTGYNSNTTFYATGTLDNTHYVVFVDATGAAVTINLPAASAEPDKAYIIKRLDGSANIVTIDPDGAETIDGDATKTLVQYDSIQVQSNGSNWFIL